MGFRFWKRTRKWKVANKDLSATDPPQSEPPVPEWLATLSISQILALQRVVGNQALLQILSGDAQAAQIKRTRS